MFPIEIDRNFLHGLPVSTAKDEERVFRVLNSVTQNVISYFEMRGLGEAELTEVQQRTLFGRLKDENDEIALASVIFRTGHSRMVYIHEHLFDLASAIFPDPELVEMTPERSQLFLLLVFLLRHQYEHVLYPDKQEIDVINSDVQFATDLREQDNTAYKLLLEALSDRMNGIIGDDYVTLVNMSGEPNVHIISGMVSKLFTNLASLPAHLLEGVFADLDYPSKLKVLDECIEKSSRSHLPLITRATSLRKLFVLFSSTIRQDENYALELFKALNDRWSLKQVFVELDCADKNIESMEIDKQFEVF